MELDQARYQYDTARGAVEQAEGAVATAKSYQSYATIPAPFSGRVVDQLCDVGDLASPGRPLMTIEDPSRLRLFASLDAAKAAAAVVGSEISVRMPSTGDRIFKGTITEVVPAADPATRSILIKVDLEPDRFAPLRTLRDRPASVRGATGPDESLVPPSCSAADSPGVFVADAGHAGFRDGRTGGQ